MQFSDPIVLWDGETRRDGEERPRGDVTYVVTSDYRLRKGLLRKLTVAVVAAVAVVMAGAQATLDAGHPPAPPVVRQAAAPVPPGGAEGVTGSTHGVSGSARTRVPARHVAATPPAARLVAPAPGLSAPMARSLAKATQAAAAAGITLHVTSGYRTRAEQQQLFDDAVAKYGSAAVARRWVLPPGESEHVQGRAVDIGPRAAARWLEVNGVKWGLCRRYVNEWWHFERLAPAVGQKCPPLEADAAGG